jgi:glucan-binding YG repeat protein
MKQKVLKLILIILLVAFIPYSKLQAAEIKRDDSLKLQIAVMSDMQIMYKNYYDRFQNALKDIKISAPYYDAIALVGDMTETGAEYQYNGFMNIVSSNIPAYKDKVIAMGNHEYAEMWGNVNLIDSVYKDRFIKKTSMPGVYYDKWIKGYHFITLGGEDLANSNGNDAIISDKQYSWLETTLSLNADSRKPIFVFLHQPIPDTVYGSEYWHSNLYDGRLISILKKYPQAILFSGHSHNLLDHPRTVYQDGFTMVNTGSVAYTWYNGGEGPSSYSQGLVVNVYDDKVEIKTREFSTGEWIKTFEVKVPFQQTIYDKEAPKFREAAFVSVKNVGVNTAAISFDSAIDNTQIDEYVIKSNGEVIKTEYIKYWEQKNRQEIALEGLTPNTEYKLEIFAKDSWRNLSEKAIKTTFTTLKLSGWVLDNNIWSYYVDNEKVKGWVSYRDKWYYLDNEGNMNTGWVLLGSKWYYMNENGAMATGWIQDNNVWYFLNEYGFWV